MHFASPVPTWEKQRRHNIWGCKPHGEYHHAERVNFEAWSKKYLKDIEEYMNQMNEGKGIKIPNCVTAIEIPYWEYKTEYSVYHFAGQGKTFKCMLKHENQKKSKKVTDDEKEKEMRQEYVKQFKKEIKVNGREIHKCNIVVYEVKRKSNAPEFDLSLDLSVDDLLKMTTFIEDVAIMKEKCILKESK